MIVLTACQQPTTYGPHVSKEELAQEEAAHRDMAARAEIDRKHKSQLRLIDMEERLNRVSRPIAEAGARLCVQIRPTGSQCVFDFMVEKDKNIDRTNENDREVINAYADGEHIFVTPGMMRFIQNDEELALVLSHELAHNVMGHVASKQINMIAGSILGIALDTVAASQGYNTQGGFTRLGGDVGAVSYSTSFEKEADYVGLYIMSQSGYEVRQAENFWRRFSVLEPEAIQGSITHPSNPERFLAMKKTINEIQYKRQHRVPLVPDFKVEN